MNGVHVLEPVDYDRVRPLFRAVDDQLAATAILQGAAPATVYVDDPAQPRAAFTWTGYRFFLVGSSGEPAFNEALRQLLAETIYPEALAAGREMLELKCAPAGWEDVIGTILPDKAPIKARRHYYRFRELEADWRALLPHGFRIEFITAALLARTHLADLDLLREEMCSERPSVGDFLAQSFGVCALHDDDALAGWCTSEYNSGNRCEIGIGTLEPYQRRGIATAMGCAFVEHALSIGVTEIGWHCWARNTPSIATALKIGFEIVREYPTYLARVSRPGD